MNSRDRALMALNHQEADRIPFDAGGTPQTGLHVIAYRNVRRYLGLPAVQIGFSSMLGQKARLDEDFLDQLQSDTRLIMRRSPTGHDPIPEDRGDYWAYTDDWGVGWKMPKTKGSYFDACSHPLDMEDVHEALKTYVWPDLTDARRFTGMREHARNAREKGKLVVLAGTGGGFVEHNSALRSYVRFYEDLGSDSATAGLLMDKLLELKITYCEAALAEAGEYIDVVIESEDVAGQDGLLISPELFRREIKPRQRKFFAAAKRAAPHVKTYLHSCGAVRSLIPDWIEIGVEILNPVQTNAAGMDPFDLKRDFGKDIVFWGGGVNTQGVLGKGTSQTVRDNVRRSIDALAPGGGFVFTPDHVAQPEVTPENYMAMWETLQEYGVY